MRKLLTISFFLFYSGSAAQVNLDSLWNVWNDTSQADTNRLKAINDIAWKGHLFTRPDSAFYYAQMEYDFAQSTGNRRWMASALNTQGAYFYFKSDYEKAIEYYEKSLKIRVEIGDKKEIAGSINNIGNIYVRQGIYFKALEYFYESLKIYEEIDYKRGISYVLNGIGVINNIQGDYDKALENYSKSLKIREEINYKQGIKASLCNIGEIYGFKGNYDKAIEFFNKSLKISEEINNIPSTALILNNIGMVYQEQGDYDKAFKYYTKSLKIREEIGDNLGIAQSLINLGDIHNVQGKYYTAISYSNKALLIAKEFGLVLLIRDALKVLYESYKKTGNHSGALKIYEGYITMRDSIQNEENQREIIRKEYKYVYEKQAATDSVIAADAIKVADAQIAAQQAQLTQEKTQRYALNGGSLALLSVALIIIRGQIIKRKKEKQIYHVNQLLAKEKLIANEKELEYNKQQLNTFINNIVKKNIIIQKLKRELENISSKEVMRTSQI